MEQDLATKKRLGSPSELRLRDVSRFFESLEPASILAALEEVSNELVGPNTSRIFTFAPHDPTKVVRFGLEGASRSFPAPALSSPDPIFWGHSPIDSSEPPAESFRAHLPLRVGEEPVGILEADFREKPDASGVATLIALSQPLSLAARNSQTFEKTRRLTFTDDLTALYNSRFMALYLDRELKRCRRMRSALSLLFMDLDGFKAVNDTHGHLAGSRTLVEVGAVLEKTVRDADVLIRYGGDEFVILFPETPLSGGLIIAERIRRVVGETRFLESLQLDARVSASIGIAAYPENADDARSLIACADQAMYQAKALGKDRVVAASPLSPSSKRP